ncbi:HNH endonuclease signature motif containing protein [Ruania zhangjianzhongii]|uniref:HNH endonuclease signature motif containing protein n=3 Tax=Ruania zhangjianzhongii TaxID=2603206 RepID=UPI00143CDC94|nr:HNH endonuclease signature motif containing protein [Ruania zhangjianzhongii]
MTQTFDHSGRRGRPSALAVVEVCRPLAAISPGGLAGLADSVAERALVDLIGAHQVLPVDERLARRSVDSQLFALLSQLDTEVADEATLVEAAAAADRVEAAAHAVKLRAAAALSRRQAMRPAALAQREATQRDVAGDELAVRLRTTVRAGMDLVRRGKALEEALFATGDALARGVIDAARARVIVDGLEHVSAEVAATVESRVLGRAPERTVAQLRSDVAKALVAVDADEAAERARYRASQRRVSRPRALPDGIASMRLEGPAADVLALDVALQAAARAAKAAGDGRCVDQLRFDALAGIAHHGLATGCLGGTGAGLPLGSQHGHRPTIAVTIPLDQLLPPAQTSGTNGATPDGWTASGDTTGGGTTGGGTTGGGTAGGGGASRDQSGAPPVEDDGAWPPPLPGQHLHPGQVPSLEGYGPISPLAARALAAGGDWIRIVTDPLTGAVLDVGHTRYRPTQAMVEHILARDRTCARPGCSHRASECQLDHTQEWNHDNPDHGGTTAVSNLGPLCPRDHTVKTHGDFHLTQTEPGTFEWTTPTGHRYRREPDGTTTSLTHPTHQPRYSTPTNDNDNDNRRGNDNRSGNGNDNRSGNGNGNDNDPPSTSTSPPDYGPPPF